MTEIDFAGLVKQHYDPEKNNLEEIISLLKEAGASQMQSVKALISSLNLSLKEADQIILNSASWKDRKEDVEKFRNSFTDFVVNKEWEVQTENAIRNLSNVDLSIRKDAMEMLTGLFEFGEMNAIQFQNAMTTLLSLIEIAHDETLLENYYGALLTGLQNKRDFQINLPWEKLINNLSDLNDRILAQYAIPVIALTGKKEFVKVLAQYSAHPNETVRDSSRIALVIVNS